MVEDPVPPSAVMASSTTPTTTSPEEHSSDIQKPLAEDIVVTTRNVHAKINRLIMARLPLALPPQATDSGPYISGMLHFLPIYMTFEKLWRNILDTPYTSDTADSIVDGSNDTDPPLGNIDNSNTAVCERVHSILKHLYLPDLMRSHRLRADIRASTGWSDEILNEQLKTIGETGRIGDFVSHIKRAVHNKPHVLVAYSYILFMALFAGGRFVRASFEKAGNEFWEAVPSPIKPGLQPCDPDAVAKADHEPTNQLPSQVGPNSHASNSIPLRFWGFDTAEDGEDLKREYKEKLFDWEDKLSPQERHDIIQESIFVFENVGLIVGQLDEIWQEQEEKPGSSCLFSVASVLKNHMGSRLRDSVLVTRERSVKNSSKYSSSSETTPIDEKDDAAIPTGIDRCPGLPKSMKFAKSLPVPPRGHPVMLDGKSSDSLKMASQGLAGIPVSRWAFVGVVGLVLLCSLFMQSFSLARLAV